MKLILIAGMPATGKSTLAKKLALAFRFPVLEKDEIKEELIDTLGFADAAGKRALDDAANAVLLRCTEALLQSGSSLIAVNNFGTDMQEKVQSMIDRCGCDCVTVFLNGDADVLYLRYVERDRKRLRHLGHTTISRYPMQEGDTIKDMTREYYANRFEKAGMAEFTLKGPRIDLDATYPERMDVEALIARINGLFRGTE